MKELVGWLSQRKIQVEMVVVDTSVDGCGGWKWQEAWRKSTAEQIYGYSEAAG